VFSSYVAFGDFEGYLHMVSQIDGHFVARERINSSGLRVRPLVVGDWMYVFANNGDLVALTIR
jgi:outer membrane protein assembly factor BamB